jgi:hypothetical protein
MHKMKNTTNMKNIQNMQHCRIIRICQCVKYVKYVEYAEYAQKRCFALLCVLSFWYRVSQKHARRRPPCHPRVLPSEWFSFPPPPWEKALLGLRAPRSLSARHVVVSWRAACAWPVPPQLPRRRVELRDNHTLLRTTEPPLHCMHSTD